MKVKNPVDFEKLEALNLRFQQLSSAPGSPVEGQVYWDSTNHRLYIYNANATAWQLLATNSDLLGGQSSAYHLSRTNHTGSQAASTISDLASVVQAYRLDQFAAPNTSVSMNSQKITNVANGTNPGDAINRSQLDAVIQGLDNKHTAEFASTANLSATYSNGTSGVGATLTATSNAAISLDGGSPALNDLVLIKDQTSGFQNGLYVVTQVGSGAAPFVLTRSDEMDTATEFGGALVAVRQGSANGGSLYMANVSNSITVGTTSVLFTKLNSAVTLTAGNGISIVTNTISAVADPSGGLTVGASGIAAGSSIPRKFGADIGDGSSTTITVTHNLNTRDVVVSVALKASTYDEVLCDITHATVNTVTITFAVAPSSAQYRVTVIG